MPLSGMISKSSFHECGAYRRKMEGCEQEISDMTRPLIVVAFARSVG